LLGACQSRPTYLDRYYSLQPGRPNGAKRLVLLVPDGLRTGLGEDWLEEAETFATVICQERLEKVAVQSRAAT
jgi:hypothetical protein